MPDIYYTSWSAPELVFELKKLKNVQLTCDWKSGLIDQIPDGSIYLTTNGYNSRSGDSFVRASLYAESYLYLQSEHDNWHKDQRWDYRFHYNPNFYNVKGCLPTKIGGYWLSDLELYHERPCSKECLFGMVLGHKPDYPIPQAFGWFRRQIVAEIEKYAASCQDKSSFFRLYGPGWGSSDFYLGEVENSGPDRFVTAKRLMTPMKFAFCLENTRDPYYSVNYLTEKIFHALLTRTIPIYAGCWNVNEHLGGAYVDLADFDMDVEAVLRYCENMNDTEYHTYLEKAQQFLSTHGLKYSWESVFQQVDTQLMSKCN